MFRSEAMVKSMRDSASLSDENLRRIAKDSHNDKQSLARSIDMRLIWPSLSLWATTIAMSHCIFSPHTACDGAELWSRIAGGWKLWLCAMALLAFIAASLKFFRKKSCAVGRRYICTVTSAVAGIFVGVISSTIHYTNPWASEKIYASVEEAFTNTTSFAGAYADRRRTDLLQAVASMPDYVRGLVPGVVIGDDSALPYSMVETMRMLGLSHVTAVSGAHVSLVLGVVMRLIGRRFPKITALMCAGALYMLIVLVGPEASVMRAGMMGMMMVCSIWASRPASGIPMVCSAVSVASVLFPKLAVSLGFILSASSTLAITVCAHPLVRQLRIIMPRWCAEFISLPLIAGIVTAPIIASIQGESSMWTVLANAIVAPAIAPLTLCGLAVVILLPIWAGVAHGLLVVCGVCAWWINEVAYFFADAPGSHSGVWSVFGLHCVLVVLLLSVSMYCSHLAGAGGAIFSKKLLVRVYKIFCDADAWSRTGSRTHVRNSLYLRHYSGKDCVKRRIFISRGWVMKKGLGVFFLVAVGIIYLAQSCGIISFPFLGNSIAKDWEIVQCDVGQGSALLVRHSDSTVLIDTGPQYGHIDTCLKKAGVRELDLLILSHFDADHVRGLDLVMDTVKVREAWVSENPYPLYNSEWALNVLERHGVLVNRVRAGASLGEWLTIESPQMPLLGEEDGNADSLVVRAQTQNYSMLNLADISQEIQDNLLDSSPVDVVIVAHHGSASQSPELAEELNAQVALISAGHNSYGHPTDKARNIWDSPIQAVTKECGYIVIAAEGIQTQRRCATEWK